MSPINRQTSLLKVYENMYIQQERKREKEKSIILNNLQSINLLTRSVQNSLKSIPPVFLNPYDNKEENNSVAKEKIDIGRKQEEKFEEEDEKQDEEKEKEEEDEEEEEEKEEEEEGGKITKESKIIKNKTLDKIRFSLQSNINQSNSMTGTSKLKSFLSLGTLINLQKKGSSFCFKIPKIIKLKKQKSTDEEEANQYFEQSQEQDQNGVQEQNNQETKEQKNQILDKDNKKSEEKD